MKDNKHQYEKEAPMLVSEPAVATLRENSVDGMLAYITDKHVSASLRRELGHRLIAEAERDMKVRPAFELELYLRELYSQNGDTSRLSVNILENAFNFVNACNDTTLLSKAAVYQTDHATIMLKIILGDITSSVDIGKSRFTYAIVNSLNASTAMGGGDIDDINLIKNFYRQLKTFKE